MTARALMFQGTGSSVGKSVLVAGLARLLTRRGLRVRPFKPQNMSNNAAVVPSGGEIGRAQALQAYACGVEPEVHMNPVLLKPQSQTGAQVIVQGKLHDTLSARAFQRAKRGLLPYVMQSFNHLAEKSDIILVEGAGSASEINLRPYDIANMGFAEAADIDVVLIGDIDRGGVIASLVGTQAVLPPKDASRIKGFIVNRMRGDIALFSEGMDAITRQTRWRPVGLVPFLDALGELPMEDRSDLAQAVKPKPAASCRVAVLVYPMIANFDDFDPLRIDPDIELVFVFPGVPIPAGCDLVILPGSKSTMSDLAFLKAQGWDVDIAVHLRHGGYVLGICGGYQMLGREISDPHGYEGGGTMSGLGLLDVSSVLEAHKTLALTQGQLCCGGWRVRSYEIHMGQTTGKDTETPFMLRDGGCYDGAISPCGKIMGTYQHGLFNAGTARRGFLKQCGIRAGAGQDHEVHIDTILDSLASHLQQHLDIGLLLSLAR